MTRAWPLLFASALALPASPVAAAPGPGAVRIVIRDHTFVPHIVRVKAGRRIVWRNDDQDPHTVTSGANNTDDGRWKSSPLIPDGATFALHIDKPGTYPYFCKPHQFQASMHGTIVVTR